MNDEPYSDHRSDDDPLEPAKPGEGGQQSPPDQPPRAPDFPAAPTSPGDARPDGAFEHGEDGRVPSLPLVFGIIPPNSWPIVHRPALPLADQNQPGVGAFSLAYSRQLRRMQQVWALAFWSLMRNTR